MVYIESPCGLKEYQDWINLFSTMHANALHRVALEVYIGSQALNKTSMKGDNQIKAKGTIFMSCCYD